MTASLPDIRLRAMEPEDLDFLYEIENDKDVWDVGATNVPYSRYTLYEYMSSSKNDIYADRQVRLIIEDSGSNRMVGMVDMTGFDPRHMRAEIGVVIQKAQRRKGYATAALAKVTSHAFTALGLHQLYAIVAEDNLPSLRLFESCGFTRAARLDDWLRLGGEYKAACLLTKRQNISVPTADSPKGRHYPAL